MGLNKSHIPALVALAGLLLVVAGTAAIYLPAGFIVAGAGLIFVSASGS